MGFGSRLKEMIIAKGMGYFILIVVLMKTIPDFSSLTSVYMMTRLNYKQDLIQTNEIFMKLSNCFFFIYSTFSKSSKHYEQFKLAYYSQMILNGFVLVLVFRSQNFHRGIVVPLTVVSFSLRALANSSRLISIQCLSIGHLQGEGLVYDLAILDTLQALAKILGVLLSLFTTVVYDLSYRNLANLEKVFLFQAVYIALIGVLVFFYKNPNPKQPTLTK